MYLLGVQWVHTATRSKGKWVRIISAARPHRTMTPQTDADKNLAAQHLARAMLATGLMLANFLTNIVVIQLFQHDSVEYGTVPGSAESYDGDKHQKKSWILRGEEVVHGNFHGS